MRNLNLFPKTMFFLASLFALYMLHGCKGDEDPEAEGIYFSNESYDNPPTYSNASGLPTDLLVCKERKFSLYTSSNSKTGELSIINDAKGNLYITFDSNDTWDLKSVAISVGIQKGNIIYGIPVLENNVPDPASFQGKESFGTPEDIHTFLATFPQGEPMFETIVIAATAVVVNGSNEETVWAGNVTGSTLSEYTIGFNDNSWPYLFYFTPESCVYNFAWEDKKTSDNDQDYNDIIIKSHTERNGNDYLLKFRVVARGASFNHDFKIRLLKTDVANSSDITGAIEVADSTNFWEVLIFENTYDDPNLAGEGEETVYNTNTCSTSGLVAERTITVKNSTLTGNDLVPPFDPILFVDKNKEDGLDENEYYLNIWEIHAYSGNNGSKWYDGKGDTYVIDTQNYPNGIMIPQAWKWPREKFQINGAYTRFSNINSWKADWYSKDVVDNGLMDCDVD